MMVDVGCHIANKGDAMSNTTPERNRAIVLEAFQTLFNKSDYQAAEGFWSPNYSGDGNPANPALGTTDLPDRRSRRVLF